jgi:hypothetical protein
MFIGAASASFSSSVTAVAEPSTEAEPTAFGIYKRELHERLPRISFPLRERDADVVVDLQPLVDDAHVKGRYININHRRPLDPPLTPAEQTFVRRENRVRPSEFAGRLNARRFTSFESIASASPRPRIDHSITGATTDRSKNPTRFTRRQRNSIAPGPE